MCDPVSMTLAAVSAGSAIFQGQAQKAASDAQAQQLEQQAAYQRDQAQAEARLLRERTARTGGAARAALGASGVQVGEGTALVIDRDIAQRGERDAFSALLSGDRVSRTSLTEAGMARAAGRNAVTASVLQAGSAVASGWRLSRQMARPAVQPTYAPPDYGVGW